MRKQTKIIAYCGVTAALSIVVMVIGNFFGLGMYLAPMLVGLFLSPAGRNLGKKYQILLWISISLLSFMLISNPEQNLMFACLFGWYPIIRPVIQKWKNVYRVVVKFLVFNVVVIALEVFLILFLVPENLSLKFTILLLGLGNITFFVYDLAIPRFESLLYKHIK